MISLENALKAKKALQTARACVTALETVKPGVTVAPDLGALVNLFSAIDADVILKAAGVDPAAARWVRTAEHYAGRLLFENGELVDVAGYDVPFKTYSTTEATAFGEDVGIIWCRADLADGSPVLAELRSDDGGFVRNVDIRPWLQAADPAEIVWLLENDFPGSTERDAIAHFLEGIGDPSAKGLFDYQGLVPRLADGDPNGFEIEIGIRPAELEEGDRPETVETWLRKHRPEVDLSGIDGPTP